MFGLSELDTDKIEAFESSINGEQTWEPFLARIKYKLESWQTQATSDLLNATPQISSVKKRCHFVSLFEFWMYFSLFRVSFESFEAYWDCTKEIIGIELFISIIFFSLSILVAGLLLKRSGSKQNVDFCSVIWIVDVFLLLLCLPHLLLE